MAKVTITRLFEVSRYLATQAGTELKDALVYLSEFAEVVTRNLRNGLTFQDNFDVLIKRVQVLPDTESVVLPAQSRRVNHIMVRRSVDDTYYEISSFGWKYKANGEIAIKAGFTGSPSATTKRTLELIIFYG